MSAVAEPGEDVPKVGCAQRAFDVVVIGDGGARVAELGGCVVHRGGALDGGGGGLAERVPGDPGEVRAARLAPLAVEVVRGPQGSGGVLLPSTGGGRRR